MFFLIIFMSVKIWSTTRIIGPLMFLIYINDLPVNTQSTCKFLRMTHLYFHMLLINSHQSVNLIRTCRL